MQIKILWGIKIPWKPTPPLSGWLLKMCRETEAATGKPAQSWPPSISPYWRLTHSKVLMKPNNSLSCKNFSDGVVSWCWDQEPQVFWNPSYPLKGKDYHHCISFKALIKKIIKISDDGQIHTKKRHMDNFVADFWYFDIFCPVCKKRALVMSFTS